MGTPGSGRKRTPVKDRFSAEDEALGHIAREAEARLAAKRAARAEARDIRMRELERQQKEGADDLASIRSTAIQRNSALDASGSHRNRASTSRRRDLVVRTLNERAVIISRLHSHTYGDAYGGKKPSSYKDLLSGFYHDQRNYSSLRHSKPLSTYHPRASLYGGELSKSYSNRTPSEYSYYSSRTSSARSSPVFTDDESGSVTSSDRAVRGRRDSVSSDFSDHSETAADYFSRSNRRGSIVSDLDDVSIPDVNSLEEKSDRPYSDLYIRPASRNSVTPLSGNSSRRGSGDTSSLVDPDTSLSELRDIYDLKDQIQDVEGRYMQGLKELKESLAEVEEKYKKAMVSNAQLDNEKNNLIYQVDTLKDVIEEREEQLAEYYRENEEKTKELERQKHMCTVLQHKVDELKEGIRQRDELIEENQRMQQKIESVTKEVFDLQETVNWKDKKIGALERQKEYFDCIRIERDELRDELADLKETMKTGEKHGLVIIPDGTPNGDVNHEPLVGAITVVSQEAAQVLESAGEGPLDIRLRKLAGEKEELLSQVVRLEGQVVRYKTAAENAEKVEDELKAEKRKLQRELRTALDRIEEMEMTNSHLVKRLEKMKANRTALLSQQ
ncbi:hypothetical protein JD844_002680 [Phrynosoma platyrhinos]|uniref:Leucine-rich repeat flightless-interacting protein 2 n=1 Tax=Phrynosoma platyrhinos TaxID=52577 RepID=A0ABQ7TDF1_PHRPL|nr:hypothetical protein JD844_002680 [Phrynosoma platyrhinos]